MFKEFSKRDAKTIKWVYIAVDLPPLNETIKADGLSQSNSTVMDSNSMNMYMTDSVSNID